MRVFSRSSRSPVSFNMTPMIDVVFLLIIFFLVSSHLARRENRLRLPLPIAESGYEESRDQGRHLTVSVLHDGTIYLRGQSLAVKSLAERLIDAKEKSGENVELKIRADRAVAYRHIAPIMLASAREGIWNVTFSVIRSEDAN